MSKRVPILAILVVATASNLLAASHVTAAFKKLQALAGEWEGTDDKHRPVKTNFKSIVSNTAVMETLSPSGMEEMVTVYSLDGDGIALIHFCPTNNQPRMRAVPGNLPSPNTGHQHHLVIQFEDEDHITEVWTWRHDGMDMPMVFHLTRKRK